MPRVLVELEKLKVPHSGLGQFCVHVGERARAPAPGGPRPLVLRPRRAGRHVRRRRPPPRPLAAPQAHRGLADDRSTCGTACTRTRATCRPRRATRLVLTIHDLNFLQKYSGWRRSTRLRALQRRIDRADAITFISAFTEAHRPASTCGSTKPTRVVYNGNSLRAARGRPAAELRAAACRSSSRSASSARRRTSTSLVPFLRALASGPRARRGRTAPRSPVRRRRSGGSRATRGSPSAWRSRATSRTRRSTGCHANARGVRVSRRSRRASALPVVEAMSLGKPVFLSTRTSRPETGAGRRRSTGRTSRRARCGRPSLAAWPRYRADPGKPARLRAPAAGTASAGRLLLAAARVPAASRRGDCAAAPVTRAPPRAAAASRT